MDPSRDRPMAHRHAARRAPWTGSALLLAAALAAPALAQKETRGVDTNPPPASVRIVDQVNQGFTLPYAVTVFGSPDASRAPVGRLEAGAAVEVVGVVEGQTWLQIRLADGTLVYVVATAIPGVFAPRPPATPQAPGTQPAAAAPGGASIPGAPGTLPPPPTAPGAATAIPGAPGSLPDPPTAPATTPATAPSAPAAPAASPAAPPAEAISGPVLVHDTSTLVMDGRVLLLAHVRGIGGSAAQGLQAFIRESGGAVTCTAAPAGHVCTLPDGTDIAMAALVNGAAGVRPGAPDAYRTQAEDARRNRRGLWARVEPAGSVEEQLALILPEDVAPSAPPPAFRGAQVAENLAYLIGQPFAFHEGEVAAVVFVPAIGWGYWDRRMVWHAAPAAWLPQLERRNPNGTGIREVDVRRYAIPVIPRPPASPAQQGR